MGIPLKSKLRYTIFLTTFALVSLLVAVPARAERTYNDAQGGLTTVVDLTGIKKTDALSAAGNIAKNVLYLLGLIFLILMVYAGIKWMTAKGDEDQVTKARDTVFAAVIGLAIVLASYALSTFVNDRILNQEKGLPQAVGSDTQGGEALGCCRYWPKANDLGVNTVGKMRMITTESACKGVGEENVSQVVYPCTGPADGCWLFSVGVTDDNDCSKL